jgi:flagellar basal-body rod protein FlgG
MFDSLWISASGLFSQQLGIDTIANNISNINTNGFKKTNIGFQDLWYQEAAPDNTSLPGLPQTSTALWVGTGANASITQKVFSQGVMEETGDPYNLAIEGKGFFRVTRADGSYAYTRDGAFSVDAGGDRLVNGSGYVLDPAISIPEGASSVSISREGKITATFAGEAEQKEFGQVILYKFVNPAGLSAVGENLFAETSASGQANEGVPGSGGFGQVVQGYLERSNVDIVEEMAKLITAQRAYELNSRAVRNADEMLSIANNIRS